MMPLLTNPDPITLAWAGFVMEEKHQLVLSTHPAPIVFILSALYTVFSPFLSKSVFSEVMTNTAYTPSSLSVIFRTSYPDLSNYLLISKMPYLAFDFLLALILLRMIKDQKKSLLAFKLWMLSPVAIYVSYVVGQYDIIPVFFFVLALYFFQRDKMWSAALSVGIAGAFKSFAFLFVLPFIIVWLKNVKGSSAKAKKFSLFMVLSLVPTIVSQIIVFLTPQYYFSANMAASEFDIIGFFGNTTYWLGKPGQPALLGLLTFSLDYSIGLKTFPLFYDVIYIFPVAYTFLLLGLVYWKKITLKGFSGALLVFLLVYYASSLFHLQWFLIAQPLLLFMVVENPRRFLKPYILLSLLYFVYNLYWIPEALALLDNAGLPSIQIVNLFRSIFSGVCIFIVILMIRESRVLEWWRLDKFEREEAKEDIL